MTDWEIQNECLKRSQIHSEALSKSLPDSKIADHPEGGEQIY
jgi:hypothetical protein